MKIKAIIASLLVAVAALTVATEAVAQDFSASRRVGGGFNFYDSNGLSSGYATPRIGGGFDYYGSNGLPSGSSSPRVGGGFNYYGSNGLSSGYATPRVSGGFNYFQHRNYRQASLWFDFDEQLLGVKRAQVDSSTARRGTVEHRILEGRQVVAFADSLPITVSCKAGAGSLTAPIPYALALSLEVAEPLEVSIFDQVRNRIRPRVEIEPEG